MTIITLKLKGHILVCDDFLKVKLVGVIVGKDKDKLTVYNSSLGSTEKFQVDLCVVLMIFSTELMSYYFSSSNPNNHTTALVLGGVLEQ